MDDVKDILYPALGVAVGVLLAGLAMHYGKDLPGIKQAHKGFDS